MYLRLVSLALAGCVSTVFGSELTQETFTELQDLISPQDNEQQWLEIPWETDLNSALEKAKSAGRPVFLWEMDGHPLGCT